MRAFAPELDHDVKGIGQRDACIERLIRQLPEPELVVLPEANRGKEQNHYSYKKEDARMLASSSLFIRFRKAKAD